MQALPQQLSTRALNPSTCSQRASLRQTIHSELCPSASWHPLSAPSAPRLVLHAGCLQIQRKSFSCINKRSLQISNAGKDNWCRPGTSGCSAHWLGRLGLGPSPLCTITWNPNALLTGFPRLPARPVLGRPALVLQLTAGLLRAVSPVALSSSLTAVFSSTGHRLQEASLVSRTFPASPLLHLLS